MVYLFWFSIFFVLFSYIGYPFFLWLITLLRRDRVYERRHIYPKVTLFISAFNEEEVIGDKLINSLALDYPRDMLEIVVVSDGSRDRTNQIVAGYEEQGVVLRNYDGRIGKTACLNRAVPTANGDIIVFSDANSQYDRNAVKELTKHFADEKIGFVTGHTKYRFEKGAAVHPVGIYSTVERLTKRFESRLGSCVGADGAIFAIRKELYRPLKDVDINDFVIPLTVVRQGFRGVLEENAFCREETAKGSGGEFHRQARIANRTIRAILNNADMLNPFKFGGFSLELFSHKMSKFLAPFFMLALLAANIALLGDAPIYILTLAGQALLYGLSLLGYGFKTFQNLPGLISVSQTFTVVNLAILWGWMGYFSGRTYTTWTTAR